jgi:transposase
MEQAKRQRRRHGPQLKRQILDACAQPGASVAAVALAHGINANLVHKWRRAVGAAAPQAPVPRPDPLAPSFVALPLPAVAPAAALAARPIEIELRRGAAVVQIRWPQSTAAECATWLRAWLT